MGRGGHDRKVADVASVLGRLKIGSSVGTRHKTSLLETILDAGGDADEIDTNYPMLMLLSDVLLGHSPHNSSQRAPGVMTRLASLVRQCGIPTDLQHDHIRHFSHCVGAMLFGGAQESVGEVLRLALRHASLYIAIVAVSGLHGARTNRQLGLDDVLQQKVSQAYRLSQRAEALLLHREKEVETAGLAGGVLPTLQESREAYMLTSACLLLFDCLTGNLDAWRGRLLSTHMWLRDLGVSSQMARLVYPMVTLHERVVTLLKEDGEASLMAVSDRDEFDRRIVYPSAFDEEAGISTQDRIGTLHCELQRIMVLATGVQDEDDLVTLQRRLDRWKEHFPLALQLQTSWSSLHDSSCFYPGLTCDGGQRSVVLHILYCECTIMLLLASPNVHGRNKVHEQVVTACKLIGSMSPESAASVAMAIAPALHLCGRHVFSSSARGWVVKTMRHLADTSGNYMLDRMADVLEVRSQHNPIKTHTRTDDDDGDVIDLD